MRPSNKSRSRNKSGNNNNNQNRRSVGNIINRVFESAGPEGKVRGTPQQIIEKYVALARDAQLANDRVAAESFQQHAEHYSRMLGEAQRQQMESRGGSDRDDSQRGEDQRDYGSRDDAQRDYAASDDNQRPDPSRDLSQRDDQRGGGQRGDYGQRDGGRRGEDQPEVVRQQPPMQPVGSGLATFDVSEGEDFSGPVETPEGARARAGAGDEPPRPVLAASSDPRPEPQERRPETRQAEPGAVPTPAAAAPEDASAVPAKRPRTRRKARPEPDTAEAQAK